MQEAAGREPVAQAPDQRVGERALGRADRVGVPLAGFEIVDRDEGRLAAHGQADVVGVRASCRPPRRARRAPSRLSSENGLVMRGCSATRVDLHVEVEIDIGEARDAGDRRGVAIMRRRGERNMAFAGQQARGRIEADPAGAGQIDLAPGVQIGEVVVGAGRPVERDEIGLELDEIAGHEAGGEAEMAQDLHQQPARIAARARAALEASPPASARPVSMRMMIADLALQARR